MTVLLVGPTTITGSEPVPVEAAEEALACIDDDLALVDDQVVRGDDLWTEVLRAATGPGVRAAIMVVPSWWSSRRVARVEAAGRCAGLDVAVRRRVDVLRHNGVHVVEIAPDVVAVYPPDGDVALVPRVGEVRAVLGVVHEHLSGASAVVIDDPADDLGPRVAHRLRMEYVDVTVADDALIREGCVDRARRRMGPRTAAAATACLAVVLLSGAALWHGSGGDVRPPSTWLVEGRVALEVPADWTTERIVDGPGSARMQIVSPSGGAIHVTQSVIPLDQSLSAAAETVRAALAKQSDGVFTGFEPSASVAGVPAMTYRENRAGRFVDWTLVLDGDVRIAIGCQGSDVAGPPEAECAHAVGTARKIR